MRIPWILKFGKDNLVELIRRQVLYPAIGVTSYIRPGSKRVKSGPDTGVPKCMICCGTGLQRLQDTNLKRYTNYWATCKVAQVSGCRKYSNALGLTTAPLKYLYNRVNSAKRNLRVVEFRGGLGQTKRYIGHTSSTITSKSWFRSTQACTP